MAYFTDDQLREIASYLYSQGVDYKKDTFVAPATEDEWKELLFPIIDQRDPTNPKAVNADLAKLFGYYGGDVSALKEAFLQVFESKNEEFLSTVTSKTNASVQTINNAASSAQASALAELATKQSEIEALGEQLKTALKTQATGHSTDLDKKQEEIIAALNQKASEIDGIVQQAINLGLDQLVEKAQEIQANIVQMKTDVQAMKTAAQSAQSAAAISASNAAASVVANEALLAQMKTLAINVTAQTVEMNGVLYYVGKSYANGHPVKVFTKVPEAT